MDPAVLAKAIEYGTLPDAYLAKSREEATEYLISYVYTYIEKEIQQEQWVRKIEPFRKFLLIAAQMNGKIINKSKIAKDVGVDDMTIASYFEILEDTLLGIHLPAFHTSVRKAVKVAPKFYFIDTGIKRAIDKTISVPLTPSTSAFGEAFEHFLFLELYKISNYLRLNWTFHYVRTPDDAEIDLIIDRPCKNRLMIEIKSATKVDQTDAKNLLTLGSDIDKNAEKYILSNDPLEQKFETVTALHWQEALKLLFL